VEGGDAATLDTNQSIGLLSVRGYIRRSGSRKVSTLEEIQKAVYDGRRAKTVELVQKAMQEGIAEPWTY
jgi:methanogenic corrinoid protein MtbC1